MKILVVDDEKTIVKGIKFNLENEGYQVDVCYDGETAVDMARRGEYAVILLDLMMPKLDGLGACQQIRQFSTVPIIMPEATRSFDSYRMVIYSLVLVLMMIFRPGGLLGSYDFSMSRIVEKVMNGELFHKKNADKEGADHE